MPVSLKQQKNIPKSKMPFFCILKSLSITQQLFFVSYTGTLSAFIPNTVKSALLLRSQVG